MILNKIPGAFTNPAYILLCLAAGIIEYLIALSGGQLFREGLFQFMTSFSLPWYAIAGAQAAETAHLPVLGVLGLAVIGPTAGRWYIDVSSCDAAGLNTWWSAGISFVIGFTARLFALYVGWEEPLAKEPAGVYQHSDGRPLLGRKIAGKSQRELKDLGLVVENPAPAADVTSVGS